MSILKIRNEGNEVEIVGPDATVTIQFVPSKRERPSPSSGSPNTVLVPAPRVASPTKPGDPRSLSAPALGWVKPTRPGTKRAKLVNLLRAGTTLERIMKAMSWSRNDAREAVRQIHRELGHGIVEKGDKLKLIEAEAGAVVPG